MKHTIGAAVVLAVLLGMVPSMGDAFSYEALTTGTTVSESKGTPDKKADLKKAGSGTPSSPAAKKTLSPAVEKTEKTHVVEPLWPIHGQPISEDDFTLHGIALGDSIKVLIGMKGNAEAIHRGSIQDTYAWKGLKVSAYDDFLAKYMNRKDLPVHQAITAKGISDFYITGGDYQTDRGIRIGSRRENVLCSYGRPDEVLWDGNHASFYLLYSGYKKELSFLIHEDQVQEIHIGWNEEKALGLQRNYKDIYNHSYLPDKDFSLAGLSLHQAFKDYPFSEWEKKMANPQEEIWYYPGYAVRMTKKEKMICAVFLTDKKMLTSRGLAIGDDAATAELLYGAPHKLEMDTTGTTPRTCYIYFNRAKDKVLLMYLKDKKVDGIVVAENPQKKK